METNHTVMGTTLRALLFVAAVFAAAIWAIVLGELVYLHVLPADPVWIALAWWIIPVCAGAVITWAIHRRRASEGT